MIVEELLVLLDRSVRVRRHLGPGACSAELLFEGGDRAIVDADSPEELEALVAAVALPAVAAREGDPAETPPAPPRRRGTRLCRRCG